MQQITELKESRQHDIKTAVEDTLIGKVIEIKTITENFDHKMHEEVHRVVSKIKEEQAVRSQGQMIELKTTINSMLAMEDHIDKLVKRDDTRYEQLVNNNQILDFNQTTQQAEIQRLKEQHATAMAKAKQELHDQHEQKMKEQQEAFQQQITTLSEEMQQIKQMFAKMAVQQSTIVQKATNANETPPRDNKRLRPSATPPGPTTDPNQEDTQTNDMDHQAVEDDEILSPATLPESESHDSQPPAPETQSQMPIEAQPLDQSAINLSELKEYDKHGA